MAETTAKPEHEVVLRPEFEVSLTDEIDETSRERTVARMRLLWRRRGLLFRVALYALLASTLVAFLIPARYESTSRLMPPDSQSTSSSLAMAVAAMSGSGGGLGGIASEFLGLKSTSDVFVGILSSRTVQDKLIQQFDLKKIYGQRRMEDARKEVAKNTDISVNRKSQIITIIVTDRSAQRAAAMAQAYVEELNGLVAQLSTSSARRQALGRFLLPSYPETAAARRDFRRLVSADKGSGSGFRDAHEGVRAGEGPRSEGSSNREGARPRRYSGQEVISTAPLNHFSRNGSRVHSRRDVGVRKHVLG